MTLDDAANSLQPSLADLSSLSDVPPPMRPKRPHLDPLPRLRPSQTPSDPASIRGSSRHRRRRRRPYPLPRTRLRAIVARRVAAATLGGGGGAAADRETAMTPRRLLDAQRLATLAHRVLPFFAEDRSVHRQRKGEMDHRRRRRPVNSTLHVRSSDVMHRRLALPMTTTTSASVLPPVPDEHPNPDRPPRRLVVLRPFPVATCCCQTFPDAAAAAERPLATAGRPRDGHRQAPSLAVPSSCLDTRIDTFLRRVRGMRSHDMVRGRWRKEGTLMRRCVRW